MMMIKSLVLFAGLSALAGSSGVGEEEDAGVVRARDDTDTWNAIASLSPAASAALELIQSMHFEYWCTEFLPYMPTPASYIVTTATVTATTTTTTTATAAVVRRRDELGVGGIAKIPGWLSPYGVGAVMQACSVVFRPGPRATTATVTATATATNTVTV